MFLSFTWLKQHVKLPDSTTAEEVAKKLKLSTVEVEGITYKGENLDGVVVGEILEITKHPNADKLSLAQVDVGETKPRQIIFGQMVKMETGFKVPVALAPTVLPGGREIKRTAMRGETSEGMFCLDQEMGLLKEGVSIQFFGKEVKPGTPITKALWLDDYILEIDNKSLSNRPDLWGHYGMAREVAVLFNREVEKYATEKIVDGKEVKLKVTVEDFKACPKFAAVAMSGIKIGPSPEWLQKPLIAVGLRPINNIVDITNFVMLDIGKPLHAFDAVTLKKPHLVIRYAKEGERLKLLDGREINLTPEMMVVASDEKPEALAGIMGGAESAISDNTTTVIFESAIWDAAMIRKTSTKLGIRTDASARFEKSLDPALCEESLAKAVELVKEVCPGAVVASRLIVEGKSHLFTGPLEIPVEFFAKKLGVEIPTKTIVSILERLGFGVTEKKKFLLVKIPSWRATKDISIAEDVVEEVARIYGYDNIPATLPTFPITPPETNKLRQLERAVIELLVRELGFTEVYNYSFVSEAQIVKFGDDITRYLELDNPLSKERPYLRRHLLNNLLENIKQNSARYSWLKLCEIGKVYHPEDAGPRAENNGDELLPSQDTWLTAVYTDKENDNPFWEARRAAEAIAENLKINWEIIPAGEKAKPSQHPARTALIKFGDHKLGAISELHPAVAEALGIEERVGVFTLNLSLAAEHFGQLVNLAGYQPLSLFPEVIRDIAFVVKKEITHADILKVLSHVDSLLTKVELFDVFMGEGIGQGYKSMAYHLTYANPARTLTTEEVDKVQSKVEKVLQDKCGAEMRK